MPGPAAEEWSPPVRSLRSWSSAPPSAGGERAAEICREACSSSCSRPGSGLLCSRRAFVKNQPASEFPEKQKKARIATQKLAMNTAQAASPTSAPPGKANERAFEYLRSKPEAEHSLEEIATHIGMGVKGARLILGKLRKAGRIRMSGPGM
jgi:hypothetical protein